MGIPQKLEDMAMRVRAGEQPTARVRELLSWFGAYRRSWRNVKSIREALNFVDLVTSPDVEGEYINASVTFQVNQAAHTLSATAGDEVSIRDQLKRCEISHPA